MPPDQDDKLLYTIIGLILGASLCLSIVAFLLSNRQQGVIIERHQPQPGDITAILPVQLQGLL